MHGKGKVSDIRRPITYSIKGYINSCLGSHKDDCKGSTYLANLTSTLDGGQDGNCFVKGQTGIYFQRMIQSSLQERGLGLGLGLMC